MNQSTERAETVSVHHFIKWPFHSYLPFLKCLIGFSALCSPTCKMKSHCLKIAIPLGPMGRVISLEVSERCWESTGKV